jgi:hypothetical protein
MIQERVRAGLARARREGKRSSGQKRVPLRNLAPELVSDRRASVGNQRYQRSKAAESDQRARERPSRPDGDLTSIGGGFSLPAGSRGAGPSTPKSGTADLGTKEHVYSLIILRKKLP